MPRGIIPEDGAGVRETCNAVVHARIEIEATVINETPKTVPCAKKVCFVEKKAPVFTYMYTMKREQ
jgi:hypothetical protein